MNRPLGLPGRVPPGALERLLAEGRLPRGWIDGFTISNDTTDATNDIVISPGAARSTVNIVDGAASTMARDQVDLEIPVSIIKQLDVAWAPENYDPDGFSGGGRSGGRSASALTDTTWHVYAIGGAGMQDDILLHDSASQASILAALPSEYTAYRMIASVLRLSSSINPFTQVADGWFYWITPVQDTAAATSGTVRVTTAIRVPLGVRVQAILAVQGSESNIYLAPPDTTDTAPTTSNGLPQAGVTVAAATASGMVHCFTNTLAQISYRNSANKGLSIATLGFWHPRGRDA